MAMVNGVLTPPLGSEVRIPLEEPQQTVTNKRKRDEDGNEPPINGSDPSLPRSWQAQRDIVEVLRQHDTQPSCLDHIIKDSEQPSPKKARVAEGTSAANTIALKLERGLYSSLHHLRKDATQVVQDLIHSAQDGSKEMDEKDARRPSVEELKRIHRLQYFERMVGQLVDGEIRYQVAHRSDVDANEEPKMVNGHAVQLSGNENDSRTTVLTLFGNAPTPRQLFSSGQRVPPGRIEHKTKVELPVEEMSLPNGLSATRIMPVPAASNKPSETQLPTLEDTFPAPYNLPALQPPKSQRRSTTRDASIVWEFADSISRANKKGGYTTQSLTVGDWLAYSGPESKEDMSSPREKRKLRERALSSGESARQAFNLATRNEALAREEESLFRRAYSNFAPSCDNSNAIVPEEIKNMIWWHKVGEKRYNDTIALDPALFEQTSTANAVPYMDESKPAIDDDFADVVDDFEAIEESLPQGVVQVERDKTKVDEVLQEISDLLETLASCQQIRNSSLPSSTAATKTPISPSPSLSTKIGRPDSPTDDEFATYNALVREIAYLVLKLPPYAVAKLDGDQLSELGVSRLLTFKNQNIRGTMAEDSVERLAMHTAIATAAGIASLTRSQSSSSGQHYSSTNQRAPAIGQAANTRYGQSYGASRTPLAQSNFQRQGSASSYSTPSTTNYRQSYASTSQYGRSSVLQPGQTGSDGQQYYPRAGRSSAASYTGYSQSFQSAAQPQQRYSSQPLAQFQQRAAQNAVAYQTNTASQSQRQSPGQFNRTASPVKPTGYSHSMPQQQQSQRPSFSAQPQTPVNNVPRPSSQTNNNALPQRQNIASQAPAQVQQRLPNGH